MQGFVYDILQNSVSLAESYFSLFTAFFKEDSDSSWFGVLVINLTSLTSLTSVLLVSITSLTSVLLVNMTNLVSIYPAILVVVEVGCGFSNTRVGNILLFIQGLFNLRSTSYESWVP